VFDVPLVERAHRHDLLRKHVERPPRHHGRLDASLQHPLDDSGGLEQVTAKLRDHDAARDLADRVARTSDALDARGDAWRRLDLQHQIDRAHVDAELQR